MSDFCKSLGNVSCPLQSGQTVTYRTHFKMPFFPQQNQKPASIRIRFFDKYGVIFSDLEIPTNIDRCWLCVTKYILSEMFLFDMKGVFSNNGHSSCCKTYGRF